MALINRIRLPFKISKPQYIEERENYRKANGEIKTLSVVIRKQYEGVTDLWPEKLHERFIIALGHDNVSIEGEKYIGGISKEGDYQIEWPDFLDYPIARATFKVNATPFNASNSNCVTCEGFTQVVAHDDIIPGDVPENHQISMSPLDNDDICCEPAQLSIVTANPDYVASVIVVEETNSIVINTKLEFASQNNVILVTYRVQCENGQYDEANIIGNMVGSLAPTCEGPTGLSISAVDTDAVAISWDAPTNPPAQYEYELYQMDNLGVPVQSGATIDTELNLGDLSSNTGYRFYLRSACGEDSFSDWQYIDFSTQPEDQPPICGRYRVRQVGVFLPGGFQYFDCAGNQQSEVLIGQVPKEVCMLQNTPGVPVYFSGNSLTTITYLGEC